MKGKKVYIILIIILIIFFLLMYFLLGKDAIEKRQQKLVLLTGDSTVFQYNENIWSDISNYIDQYNWEKFDIYQDNKSIGKNYVWHDDKWYVFDENKKAIDINNSFLGIYSNYDVKVLDFTTENNTDNTYVKEVLKNAGIDENSKTQVNTVTKFDIDGDGTEEELHIISNIFADFETSQQFAYVFMVKNNAIYILYSNTLENDYYGGCQPYISSILDADNDNNYEVLLSCAPYSEQKQTHTLYKFMNKEFKALISN